MMDTRLLNIFGTEKHLILSSHHPWLCLLCVIIGSIFSYFIPLCGQFRIDPSEIAVSALSIDSRRDLLMCVVIAIPMLVDTILDCAYTMKNQEERILWYSKVLTLSSITVPNLILLIESSGNLDMMGYRHSVYNVRITSCGCTMAYASQRALEYDMKDVSGFCLLISVLMTIAYSCRSLSCKSDPIIHYLLDKTSISVSILAYLIFGYSIHLSLRRVQLSRYRNILDDAILMVKLSTAILVSWSFTAIEIQSKGADESNTSANCIRSYVYVQMIYTVVSISIPGRIARYEVGNATRALTEKKDFIRYISHEIRTPLNTVFLGLEYVTSALKRMSMHENRESIEPIVETVHDVYSSCKVAISILNDLLTSDKIEGGKMTLDLEYVNCCNYFISLAKPFKINAREKSVAFFVDCSKVSSTFMRTAFINVDQAKMGQVIRNLISNALKFTAGGGTVTVAITSKSFGDSSDEFMNTKAKSRIWKPLHTVGLPGSSATMKDIMRLEVRDTGAGISLYNQSQLFGQYVQFNANKLQKGGGSGLGLWISKGITELHGGNIGAFSEGEGKGSVFFIELPVTYSDNLDIDISREGKITLPSPRVSKSGIFCDSRISTSCSSPDDVVAVNSSEVVGFGPGTCNCDGVATVTKRAGCNVIHQADKVEPLKAISSSTSFTTNSLTLENKMQDAVSIVGHSATERVAEEAVEVEDLNDEDEDAKFEDIEDGSRSTISLDTVKGTAFIIKRKQQASTFPISPLTQSPFISEKEPLYELAELLKKSIRTSISESIISPQKSSDILSCIYPFIANATPFQQPLLSSISSNMMGSRYGSLAASSRYYTHKRMNDCRSGKNSPNSTSHRNTPSSTPQPSGQYHMSYVSFYFIPCLFHTSRNFNYVAGCFHLT